MTALPELSHPVKISELTQVPVAIALRSTAAQRAALARRFDLVDLLRLEAEIEVHRASNGDVIVDGRLIADVVQSCVVTLESVPAALRAAFRRRFVDKADHLDIQADEDLEPLVGPTVDVGELTAQELGLALEPFPRASGAALDSPNTSEDHESPFAALRDLRR